MLQIWQMGVDNYGVLTLERPCGTASWAFSRASLWALERWGMRRMLLRVTRWPPDFLLRHGNGGISIGWNLGVSKSLTCTQHPIVITRDENTLVQL